MGVGNASQSMCEGREEQYNRSRPYQCVRSKIEEYGDDEWGAKSKTQTIMCRSGSR